MVTDNDISDRDMTEQVEKFHSRRFRFQLHTAEFLVLHFQFDLMNLEFVHQNLHVLHREGLIIFLLSAIIVIAFPRVTQKHV